MKTNVICGMVQEPDFDFGGSNIYREGRRGRESLSSASQLVEDEKEMKLLMLFKGTLAKHVDDLQ